ARYKLRLRRKRFLWRAMFKRWQMSRVSLKTQLIQPRDILLFATVRNEMLRLPHFLSHYRKIGVGHFLIVDNASDDGSAEFLKEQPDVSLWRSGASYKASRFGMDWLTGLQWRYGHGRWVITVDADELFIYPDWESRSLSDLAADLDQKGLCGMGALMLDLYPKGPIGGKKYAPGQNPTDVLAWFDSHGYWVQRQTKMDNLWTQGGPRARHFFAGTPNLSPTLNKIPMVRWDRSFVYVNSTHNALPIELNRTYDEVGTIKPQGVLLHTKFLPDAVTRAVEEKRRGEHFASSGPYYDYYDRLADNPNFWSEESVAFEGARQLEELGLMSRGNLDRTNDG
ncbi:MAG: glycosyltransferase family 2 protein, partial [Roseobacter sp.]